MTIKEVFLTLKKYQAKLVSIKLNEKKLHTNPVNCFCIEKSCLMVYEVLITALNRVATHSGYFVFELRLTQHNFFILRKTQNSLDF